MTLYPTAGALWLAGIIQTALAGSYIRLFKQGLVLTPATTQADLVAQECDFTGYAKAKQTAWQDPLLNPLGGASIDSGLAQFAAAAPYTTGNVVGGYWLEDSTAALVMASDLSAPVSCGAAGQGVPIDVTLIFG